MLHSTDFNSGSAADFICKRIQDYPGSSMVYSPNNVSFDTGNLYSFIDTPRPQKSVSIVICTYGRPDSLNDTLRSLSKQTYKDFEVILITEKGNLAELRDKGLRSGIGSIVSFIDDDVYCPPTWLESVVKHFGKGVVGVTGPTTITDEYKRNRDTFKFRRTRNLVYAVLGVSPHPGQLSSSGAPSMESNTEGINYQGPVDYLECCNMSVLREEALNVGGFDHHYYRTSEWCEVDLSLSLQSKGKLIFHPECKLYHRPSKAGIYSARISTKHRWENLRYFHKKWRHKYIKPGLKNGLYLIFVWTYFKLKEMKTI